MTISPNNEDENKNRYNNIVVHTFISLTSFVVGFLYCGIFTCLDKASEPWLYRYQTLVAGIFAIIGALFAAKIAWDSSQLQIKNSLDLSERPYSESKKFLEEELFELFSLINLMWEEIEKQKHKDNYLMEKQEIRKCYTIQHKFSYSIIKEIDKFAISNELAFDRLRFSDKLSIKELEIHKERLRYQLIDKSIHEKMTNIDSTNFSGYEIGLFVVELSHFREWSRHFSLRLYEKIEKRSGFPVNWDPMSTLIQQTRQG